MPRIMFFELKKMLTRRVALVVNVGVLVMLCGIMALNVVQARFALSDGSFIGGPAAIQAAREERAARAGQLSVERILSDVQGYRELVLSELDAADLLEMTDAAAYSAAAQAFTDEQFDTLYDPYWSWLMSPFRRSGEEPYQTAVRVSDEEFADYYEAVAQLAQDTLDEGQGGSWEYTTAERAYWTDMEASVPEPVSYGWAGAWDNIVSCVAFLAFAMLAARGGQGGGVASLRHGLLRARAPRSRSSWSTSWWSSSRGWCPRVARASSSTCSGSSRWASPTSPRSSRRSRPTRWVPWCSTSPAR
ncbi:hypothetical protein [Olsenella sp. An188]|uniref:hypothetical protein n=1 Tax=Olsenella sp. An188 TaxID=1965579 RepID=UPI000B3A9732|nr:hypothetical protein [Olsenella sp. An188]OUP39509.1 hypothetical protein B5F23_00535 [Olsenella sp. An188]